MIINKKVWPEFFEKVLSGKKKFELRLADSDVKEGDILLLREWNPKTKEYTGRKIKKRVSYVSKTKKQKFWSADDVNKYGFVIMSLE